MSREELIRQAKRKHLLERAKAKHAQTKGNPQEANRILDSGIASNMDPESIDVVSTNLKPADMEFQTASAYYSAKTGTNLTPEMVTAKIKDEYGQDATPQVANQMNRKALKWGRTKTAGAAMIETGESLLDAGAFLTEAYLKQSGIADRMPREQYQVFENKNTGEIFEARKGVPAPFTAEEFEDWELVDTIRGEEVWEELESVNFLEELSEQTGETVPQSWTDAQEYMRQKASAPFSGGAMDRTLQFLDKGGILLTDNLPNIVASRLNPALGMTVMFSNERNAAYDGMIESGINPEIAEQFATTYGALSAPVEYAENLGRVSSAFGVNPKRTVLRAIKAKGGEALKNVSEELIQKLLEDLAFNEAAKLSNEKYGTNVELRNLADIEGYTDTAVGSLAMTTVMEALGFSVKGGKKAVAMTVGDARVMRKQMTDEQIDNAVENGDFTPEQATAVREAESGNIEQKVEEANKSVFEPEVDDAIQEREAEALDAQEQTEDRKTVDEKVREQASQEVEDIVGFSTEQINKAREERGDEALTEEEVKSHKASMEEALAEGKNLKADELAQRVLDSVDSKKVYQMSDTEVAGMGARIVELRNERIGLMNEQREAMEREDQASIEDVEDRLERNRQKSIMIEDALKTSGTASGRANSMMASFINRFTYDVVGLTDMARTAKGEKLTQQEEADIVDVADKIAKVESEIESIKEQLRTGKFEEKQKRRRPQEPAELTEKKRILHQLQREAREKIFNLRKKTGRDILKMYATLPRTLIATADMSYALRQGLIPSFGHPKIAANAWKSAFKSFFSQNTADEIDVAMREDPMYDEIVGYGTHFSNMDSAIESREEFFASSVAEKIPGFGRVVRASERNMVTGLNMLRMGLMKDFLLKHPDASTESKKAYAKYVNAATGRGSAKMLDRSAEELSLVFFAPRFAYSRVQAPVLAATALKDPALRGEVIRQWSALLATGSVVLALAKAAGADVGDDPEDSDWGKIVIDDKIRIDIFGGLQQPLRILAKAVSGAVEYRQTGETDVDPITDILQYLKYKLSPPVTMTSELISGKDIIGRETEPIEVGGVELPKDLTVFIKNATPLIVQSAAESYREGLDPEVIAALAIGEGMGLSIGVYDKD